jgi:hypothetical protein
MTNDVISPAPRRLPRQAGVVKPDALELFALVVIFVMELAAPTLFGEGALDVINIGGPLALMAVLLPSAWYMAQRNIAVLWTPLFWFRISTATYFGFGNLTPWLANEATRLYMSALYPFTPADGTKVNLIVVACVLCVLFAAYVFDAINRRKPQPIMKTVPFRRPDSLLGTGLAFLAVGSIYKYGLVLPMMFGWYDFVIPGVVTALAGCSYVGLFLLSAWAVTPGRRAWPIVAPIVLFELFTGLITFSKADVMLPLLMVCLGMLTRGATPRRTAILATTVIATVFFLQPLVAHGRAELIAHKGALGDAGLEERTAYVASYFDPNSRRNGDPMVNGMLSRISYMNIDAYILNQYDNGAPGDSMRYALIAFIPRFLWPDKPITTSIATELSEVVTGQIGNGNSLGTGWFVEAYWNYGWLGVPLTMIPIGVLLAALSRIAVNALRNEHLFSLPAVFLGLKIGARVDGAIATDVIGASVMLIAYFSMLYVIRLWGRSMAQKYQGAPSPAHR